MRILNKIIRNCCQLSSKVAPIRSTNQTQSLIKDEPHRTRTKCNQVWSPWFSRVRSATFVNTELSLAPFNSCFSTYPFVHLSCWKVTCALLQQNEVFENYANPFKGTTFKTEKQNKSKLKIYFYLGTNRRYFFILIIWFYQLS